MEPGCVAGASCALALLCTWIVPDTKPPEGSVVDGVRGGRKWGMMQKFCGKVMMGRVKFGFCLKEPHWEDIYFVLVSGFSLDPRESALLVFDEGAPLAVQP